jgi:hypothetical protein
LRLIALVALPIASPGKLLVTNQTTDWALQAFTTQTESALSSSDCGEIWSAVAQDGGVADDSYTCDKNDNHGGTCRYFWYAECSGVYSLYLDDDGGSYETAFGAGYGSYSLRHW